MTGGTIGVNTQQKVNSFMNQLIQNVRVEEVQPESTPLEMPVSEESLQNALSGMNDVVSSVNTHLKFEYHDRLDEYYVTIVDNMTQEVVKEIPAKKFLDMHADMAEFMGLLVDKKA
ncbi:flagellar protein FlaG [Rossellomorea marisflavi]|uniref:flagellar protein FlaG n=1 Tax=Rossellomorea marisflavi TaxID=189381 RepID=UPI002852F952|nr:flagellar protein FlaG [Rossellomorea marisflavi]MDR4935415.1 flagellar protein FlaG [Rossellomorea marisflavi]